MSEKNKTAEDKRKLSWTQDKEKRSKSEGQEGWQENGRNVERQLLRWQSVFELHARHVVVQRHGDHLLHGADEAVLLTAVLDHQGVRLVRVEHDVVGRYN